MLSPLQDSPSPTGFLGNSDSELPPSFKTKNKKKKESKDFVGEMRN